MAVGSFVFDNVLGRAAELHHQAKIVGSPQGLIVVVIDRASAQDSDMSPATTLSGLFAVAGGIVDEVTNGNYARRTITAGGAGASLLPDIVFNSALGGYQACDLPDQTWPNVAPGDAWTDIVVCYAPNIAGADSTLVPMSCNQFPATPNNETIAAPIVDYLRAGRS